MGKNARVMNSFAKIVLITGHIISVAFKKVLPFEMISVELRVFFSSEKRVLYTVCLDADRHVAHNTQWTILESQ